MEFLLFIIILLNWLCLFNIFIVCVYVFFLFGVKYLIGKILNEVNLCFKRIKMNKIK